MATFESSYREQRTRVQSPVLDTCEANDGTLACGELAYYQRHYTPPRRPMPKGVDRLFSPTEIFHESGSMYVRDQTFRYDWPGYCWFPPENGTGNWVQKPKVHSEWCSPAQAGALFVPRATDSLHRSDPLQLLSKIQEQDLNLAMFLAEYRELGPMFADLCLKMTDIYRGIRKGKFKRLLKQGVRDSPNTWLMTRYGLTPLISDIEGVITHVEKEIRGRPIHRRYTAYYLPYIKRRDGKLVMPTSRHVFGDYTIHEITTQKDYAHVEWDPSYTVGLHRLGFVNLPALGYELIPFSFIADWVWDLGDRLKTLDALAGTKRVAAYSVRRHYMTYSASFDAQAQSKLYHRKPFVLNHPGLIPRWRPSPTWKRFVDSIALSKQQVRFR